MFFLFFELQRLIFFMLRISFASSLANLKSFQNNLLSLFLKLLFKPKIKVADPRIRTQIKGRGSADPKPEKGSRIRGSKSNLFFVGSADPRIKKHCALSCVFCTF